MMDKNEINRQRDKKGKFQEKKKHQERFIDNIDVQDLMREYFMMVDSPTDKRFQSIMFLYEYLRLMLIYGKNTKDLKDYLVLNKENRKVIITDKQLLIVLITMRIYEGKYEIDLNLENCTKAEKLIYDKMIKNREKDFKI